MLKPNQTSGPDSKPADERTAEQLVKAFKETILDCQHKNDAYNWQHDYAPMEAEIIRRITFAESERSSAIKEAREECARAVCVYCRTSPPKVGPYDFLVHDNGGTCAAAAIRALGER